MGRGEMAIYTLRVLHDELQLWEEVIAKSAEYRRHV